MKIRNILALCILISVNCIKLNGQQIQINFDDDYLERISIEEQSSWFIGEPSKTIFHKSFSGTKAILTETANYYAQNDTSSFYVYHTWHQRLMWPRLAFEYKMDADTLKDFGMIEASFDNGISWINVIKDAEKYEIEWGITERNLGGGNYKVIAGYESDSLPFTGTNESWYTFSMSMYGWDYHVPYNDTIIYKFSFISDSINTNQEGWMIDDISTEDWISGISSDKYFPIEVFPNPSSTFVSINANNNQSIDKQIKIFDLRGNLINQFHFTNQLNIDIRLYPKGIYIYQIYSSDGKSHIGKIIKE